MTMSMKEVIDAMVLFPPIFKDIGILAIILSLVQISPIKFNPWTWLKAFGELPNRVEKLEREFNDDRAFRWRNLIFNRARMFRKAQKSGELFEHEEWKDTMETITNYERYCENHPEFKNELAVQTIDYIKKEYRYVYENNLFL